MIADRGFQIANLLRAAGSIPDPQSAIRNRPDPSHDPLEGSSVVDGVTADVVVDAFWHLFSLTGSPAAVE